MERTQPSIALTTTMTNARPCKHRDQWSRDLRRCESLGTIDRLWQAALQRASGSNASTGLARNVSQISRHWKLTSASTVETSSSSRGKGIFFLSCQHWDPSLLVRMSFLSAPARVLSFPWNGGNWSARLHWNLLALQDRSRWVQPPGTSRPQRRCQGSGTKKPHSMVRPHGIVWQGGPGLWHRSNRTALCVHTASCGRSYSAAAARQAHRTASWGGQIQSRQRSCPLRGGVVRTFLAATRWARITRRVSGTWCAPFVTGGC